MDKRILRERMRRKKRQLMIRHYTKIGLSVAGLILAGEVIRHIAGMDLA